MKSALAKDIKITLFFYYPPRHRHLIRVLSGYDGLIMLMVDITL